MADNRNLGSVYFKIDADTGKVNAASKSMDDMAESADRAEGQTKKLDKSVKDTDKSAKKLEDSLKKADKQLDDFKKTIVAAAVSFVTFQTAMAGVSQIVRFEDAMLGLRATLSGTDEQMKQLEKQARSLGAASIYSAEQAAQAQRFLAMAGFDVNEVLSATPNILKLATAGQIDLAQAADIASNVLGGFRLEADELNRVNDVMAKTAASSNTSITQLGEALSYAAPIAAGAGISLEETAAAIGKLSDNGLQASRAGTGLLGIIRQLAKPTSEATTALSKYGLSASDVDIEANGLTNVLDKLRKANINTADSFTIFGSEAGPAAQILAVNSAQLAELTQKLGDAEGAASEMADIIGSGLSASFKGFSSQLSESVLQLGDSGLAGALNEVTKSATSVLAVYNGMIDEYTEANKLTAEQKQSAIDLADALSSSTTAAIGGAAAYAAYTLALNAATIKTIAFNVATRANPIALVVTALGAVGSLMYSFANDTDKAAKAMAILADKSGEFNDTQKEAARLELLKEAQKLEAQITELKAERARNIDPATENLPEHMKILHGVNDEWSGVNGKLTIAEQKLEKINEKIRELKAPIVIDSGAGQDLPVPTTGAAKTSPTTDSAGYEYDLYYDARREGAAAYNKQLKELLETYQTTITPLEQLQRDQAKLNELMKTASAEDVPKLTAALAETDKQIAALATDKINWEGLGADIAGTVTDAMISGDWEGVGTSIGSSLGGAIGGALGGPIGASIGSVVGAALLTFEEIETTFEENQRKQGTGSVLGSANEQSMSIVDSLEDNNDILKDLIGTNKNLVNALSGLVGNISGASSLISRDMPTGFGELGNFITDPLRELAEMNIFGSAGGDLYDIFDDLTFGLTSALGGLLGGSSKVSDEGIKILGGTLESILNNTTAQAFAEIKTKRYRWSSTKTKTQIQGVSSSVENQFDLIFEDIFGAVQSGAEMLGLSDADISESLESFVVRSFNISLKNMNADQQTAALEAVFSRVFDDLASAVIPFLTEFQEAGESTGETMSRLATQLEITKYALDILGQNIDALGSYEAVQLSEYLIQAAGSMETLSQNLTSFVDNFYSDYEQLELLSRQLNKAFYTLDVSLPASAEGFKDLITGIDATTEAGAEQLASLLELQGAASDYYDLLDDQTDAVRKYSESISDFTKSLLSDSEEVTAGAYRAELASALEGDKDALANITETAQTYLDSQLKTASSAEQYAAIERSVLADMNALQDKLNTVLVEEDDETNRILFDQLAALLNISDGIDSIAGGGFASGGYTGDGGVNQIAGVVHKGEYVLSQDMLKNMPVMASAPTSMDANDASVSIMRAMYGQMQSLNNQIAALKEDNYRMGIGMLNNTRDSADVLEFWRQTNVPVSIVP